MVSGLTSRLSKQFWGIIIKESNHVHLKRKDCAVFRGNLELQSYVKPGLTQLRPMLPKFLNQPVDL